MSLQEIYNDLNAALHDGNINLAATTVPDLGLTLEAIGIVGDNTLPMTGATLTMGPRAVVLTGNASYRNFTWSTTLTGESVPSGNRFTLVMQGQDATTPWKFSTSFSNLPKSRRITDHETVPLVDSVLNDLVVQQPQLSVTTEPPKPPGGFIPSFQGWLVLTGSVLAEYMDYFGAPLLRLSGGIDFAAPDHPVFTLWAAAPNASTDIPIINISEVGIKLRSDATDIFSLDELAINSVAEVYAEISFGRAVSITAEITTPLLQGNFVWPLTAVFSEPITATTGFALILDYFGQPPGNLPLFPFPLADSLLRNFGVKAVGVGIQPPLDGQSLTLMHASIALTSVETWQPSLAFITVRELGTAWTFHWTGPDNWVTGNVWGRLTFFEDSFLDVEPLTDGCLTNKIELAVNATLPDWVIQARNESDICVPLGAVLKQYFGGSGGIPDDLRITNIFLQAIPLAQTYQASLMVDGLWATQINLVKFSLDRVIGEIYVTQNKVYGSMTAFVGLAVDVSGAETTKATFNISAEYRTDGIWHFEGGLADGVLSLLDFAFALLGFEPAFELPEVLLTDLWMTYENSSTTSTNNPYSARGTLEVRWQPQVLGLTLSAVASAFVERRAKQTVSDDLILLNSPLRSDPGNAEMIYAGELSGKFTINRLSVGIAVSFSDTEEVYRFEVTFDKVTVRASTEWVKNTTTLPADGKHQILVITLSGFTLGDVVTYLIGLANPNVNYHLDAPWSFLNSIDLSRFEARIDPTEQTIALTYRVNLSLAFCNLDTVGLLYDRSSGEGKVSFILTGSLLGKRYDFTNGNPLTWDAVNDPPPEVPGEGISLIDLRYLGAGQHVTLSGLTNYNSITEVLNKLREEMQPITDPKKNPLEQSDLRFDASSQWMFGIDITVMGTVSLGIVLHDPDLYGLVLSLAGPDAGSLAGLSFELLYKKVTDDVGVFRVRLQVPDAFRQINLGYVSITLGIITVDIFTNGNFLIDLGFPHNRDFTNSFGLEAGIFIGRGGIYFGVLDGATSTRVPKITNGNFSPVVELGVGLAVGVGRTFEKGPLKAGLYIQVVAIFEGVLAWFQPTDQSKPNAMYYWARGSAGLVGKLYGSVDFKVIKVSVSVEAHAIVTFTFASHRKTLVELDVGVSVSAKVKILFVKISFHFSLQLNASFTIGSDSATPWILASDQSSGSSARRLTSNAWASSRRRPQHVAAFTREAYLRERFGPDGARLRLSGAEATYDLNWPTDINVFPDGQIHSVAIKMLPSYTIDQVAVQWPSQPTPANETPAYRINFMLMADSGVSPLARSIEQARRLTTDHLASADTVADIPFNVLIEAMFRWSLAAIGLDPVSGVVSLGQLEELARQLDQPEASASLDMSTLSEFFKLNIEMRVSGIPSGTPDSSSGTIFPIPPPLGWDSATTPDDQRRFETYQPIDSTYEHEVQQFFAQIDPQPAATQFADAHVVGADDPTESMATFIFRDYFLLIAKASVQSALTAMAAFPYTVTGANDESLSSIAELFPTVSAPYVKREGDTVDQVADAFGMTSSEILALNPNLETELHDAAPGETIAVEIGATPESIASGNPSWPLKPSVAINLGDVLHQVLDGETLASIATKFGANVDTWLQDPALLAQVNLLLPNAGFDVPQSSFVNSHSLTLALVAAFFYVRDHGTDELGLTENGDVPLVEWYVQTIGTLNNIDFAGPMPASVLVPKAFDDLSNPVTWNTQPGDTIWTVAATFAVYENQAGNLSFADWLEAVIAVNPGSDSGSVLARVIIPDIGTAVFPGEMLQSIANRFPIELQVSGEWLDQAASFRLVVKNATILAPLTPVTVPQCHVTTVTDQTISSFAALYALSLDDVGRRVADIGGLLATSSTLAFIVPHPASAPIGSGTPTEADLVPVILRDYGSSIAGQTSRYLIAGLRLPAPVLGEDGKYHATGPMTGLYELTGQQLAGPNPPETCDPPPAPTERLQITVQNYDATATWLQLYDSSTLSGEERLTAEHNRFNPGLARADKPRRGLVALTAPIEEIVYSITDVDLCENYPAPVLQQVFITPPAPRPLFRDVPVRHALQQQIVWQTTETIAIPNPQNVPEPSTGMPTLWPFSDDLMRAELLNPTKPFALCNVDPQLGPSAEPQELTLYAWATSIDIRIRTIPGLPNTYEVFGADTAGRQLLLEVWEYLDQLTDTATLHLLYQQSVSAGLPNGLTSVPVTDNATYIIKTNLTTETQSGNEVSRLALEDPPTEGDYYARLADSQRFLTLMWECSVVGGGGYWLQYTSASGAALPESIFSSDGTATLTLLVLLASQMNSTAPDRKLHSFNDTALVGNSIDASATNLFARVADLSEETREATVDPGNVAFFTSLENPPAENDSNDKQIAIRDLYGMIAYQLLQTTAFAASNPGMPVGPQVPGTSDEETWDLFQVIPIWRYALAHPLPEVDGLPLPELDPYAGITGASSGGTWTLAKTSVNLSFRDVYGNNSRLTGDASSGGPDVFDVQVGYTDPVIGIGAWPATTAHFTVSPPAEGNSGAILVTIFSLQASTHLPAGLQRTSDSATTAANQLSDFSKIYYQLAQSDVSYSLSTTLDTVGGNPHALATSGSLPAFAAGACAWLKTAAQLTNIYVNTSLTPNLAAVSETYGVGYEGLGTANANVPLSRIFTTPPSSPVPGVDFTIPVYAVFHDGSTITSLTPTGGDPVAILEDDENTSLLLRVGTELVIPSHDYTVPADPPAPAQLLSLAEIAAVNNITVASLIAPNQATPSLLREGFVFTCEGVEVVITPEHPDVTLDDVAQTFQDKGVNYDAVMVAGANPLLPGMFRAGAVLVIDRYIIQVDETLSDNGTGATVAQLAQGNTTTVDLFYSGTAIYLNFLDAASVFDNTVDDASTTYALSADQLLRFNRNVALVAVPSGPPDPLYLAIPGHAGLPSSPSSLRVPYRIPANATLDGIAALFLGATALSLAEMNEELPGVLAGNETITVDGQTVTTTDGESFSELLAKFDPPVTLTQVVSVIEATPGYLKSEALLLATPAQLAAPDAQTPLQVATRYSIDVNDFAVANSGLANIVVGGVQLVSPLGGVNPPTITTSAFDTFVSFVWRFGQLGIQTTVADVIAANSGRAFIAGDATILLAPAPASLTAPFGASGWQFPQAIFDVHAFLEIKRQTALVDPAFRGGSAEHNIASIPAVPKNNGTGADAYLALQQFAREVKAAIPVLRIATGKVLADDRSQTSTDVWGIAFGSNYIESVNIQPGVTVDDEQIPQYFALRSLDNALVSRNGVLIKPLQADGTLGAPQATDFQGVDMETWAQRFLNDADLFVSAAYAAAAYQTPQRQTLESVLESKELLAAGIAAGLDYILDFGQPDPSRTDPAPADWSAAVESLRQLLLVNLTTGYDVDAVVQYNATVSSPWTNVYAKFSGPGKLADDPVLEELRATLTSAKTSLTTTPPNQPSYVNFLLGVAKEGLGRTVELQIHYPINEVEFNIKEIVDGYDASDWVTLVLNDDLPPQVSIDLGTPSVPLPVRSYPPLPVLLGQTAVPTHPQPADYTEALLWDYAFAYQHQSMAVDQIHLEVELNQAPLFGAARALDEVDLFAALAQYNSVAPQLWDILKHLPEYASSPDKSTIENAMQTFASLTSTIATAWSSYWSNGIVFAQRRASALGPQPERYTFLQTLDATFDETLKKFFYEALYLERETAQGSLGWPVMGVFVGNEFVSMGNGVDTERGRRYDFPEGVEAFTLLSLEMRFAGLAIANYQNASSQLQVIRNANLSTLAPTRPAFIYQTQWFAFPNLVSPLLAWHDPFPIGAWTTDPATNPLTAVFTELFGDATNNRTISCGVRYGYELAVSPGGERIVPYLPVKFRPKFTYDPATTVQEIITAVQSWFTQVEPVTTGAEWLIGLNLYSSVDGQLDRPLLELPVFSTLS
ncbi:MAG TPA: LysM peptidoglycan-binding domain-containing protein [Pyrinomonadaceae bacterium]|nr:LysM peptidoglycan-binding domain-containing protein [Pyrinomonadaceae bacterium]